MSSEPELAPNASAVTETAPAPGRLVVISSPSGGGKGTLIQRVLRMVPDLGYSVSFTTRAPRGNEEDGRDYFFVSAEQFLAMQVAGDFLEAAVVHGNYYGTARSQIEADLAKGRDVILEIDVQGAELVRNLDTDALTIFVLPPSYEVLAERLTARGTERPADLQRRLRNSRGEVERYREFQYVIINDEAERASVEMAGIILADRSRRERQEPAARRVLATFTEPQNIE